MKRRQRKKQSQIAEKEHRGEELGRRRIEYLRAGEKSSANSRREEQCQQLARRTHPTAKARRAQSKEQKEQCQLRADTFEENNVSKKEVRPMTRNKDTECHQRTATEQELKVAEQAREHQVETEEEIVKLSEWKDAELRKGV